MAEIVQIGLRISNNESSCLILKLKQGIGANGFNQIL